MTTRAIHWHEGMFLRPHHFQAAQRHLAGVTALQQKWDVHFNWGVRAIDVDPDALENYRFVVRALKARLRDGTAVSIPEDGELEPLPLRGAFGRGGGLVVSLAVPVLALGQANAAAEPGRPARYLVETHDLEDENSGMNPKPVQVRRLNLRLVGPPEPAGHELLPLARVERSTRAEAAPQLDRTFFPPLLACDAWPPLQADLLQAVYDRVGKKIDLLVKRVAGGGLTADSAAPGAPLMLGQLAALNEAQAALQVTAFSPGVAPFDAYLELARAIGRLAIFGEARRAPELPRYDHDDLSRCFGEARRRLDALLDAIDEPPYDERPFVGSGYRAQVALESAWLDPTRAVFLGVQSPLPPDECAALLTQAGQLDLKVGSSGRVEEVYRNAEAGITFRPVTLPPRALPQPPGRLYLHLGRTGPDEAEWQQVQKTLSLAVRVNERMLVGTLHGQRAMTIRHGGRTIPLEFTLYVLTP